ncbi:MAG: SMC-Scp complex subunit ScpB [Candidatus Pacebacteria bacterium]|nr:SMC-Scp complex subunit ScpB [Candidatus Paceibacterota bacterium]
MALSHESQLEALLFAAGEPLPKKRLATLLGISVSDLQSTADRLRETLTDRGLALIETKDELDLRTSPEAAGLMKKLRESELSRDLGKAGLETLAIVLYKDGATRGDIDWVRGVNSSTALRSLLLRGLIRRTEDSTDRRRAFYEVTPEALAHLSAGKVSDLPRYDEFSGALTREAAAQTTAETHGDE